LNTVQAAADTAANVGPLTASVILGAFVLKLVDFIKYLRNSDWNGVVSLLITWVVGLVAVQVFIATQWGDEIRVGAHTLGELDGTSKLVLGLVIPSLASLLYDVKKAVDNTDSAATPPLVKPPA
jgi:hypothetical protein